MWAFLAGLPAVVASGSTLFSVILLIRDRPTPAAISAAVALLLAGGLLFWKLRQAGSGPRRHRTNPDARLARSLIAIGAFLLVLSLLLAPVWSAIVGAAIVPIFAARLSTRSPAGTTLASTLIFAGVVAAFCIYATLGIAAAIRDLRGGAPPKPRSPAPLAGGWAPSVIGPVDRIGSQPTYAEDCPEVPDPQKIGHGLGGLFERDGAVKAGCGSAAFLVFKTGAWVSAGRCGDELRSVAAATPSGAAAIVYGQAAQFAWSRALSGELVGIEAAEPEGGDVDLVETVEGTYAFARSRKSKVPGDEHARTCSDVGGVAEAFVALSPPIVLLWRDLLDERTAWSWPANVAGDSGDSVAFIEPASGEIVATGECESETACELNVGGTIWPDDASSFVHMNELEFFMPPPEGD